MTILIILMIKFGIIRINWRFLMINKIVKRTIKAFTLAEVLVTLGVIGVIAALTLPQLIRDFHGKILHAQLLKAYSVLSQALERMSVEENQVVNAANYYPYKFKPVFIKYFITFKDCGNKDCENMENDSFNMPDDESLYLKIENYYTYTLDRNIKSAFLDDGQFIFSDGMFVMIENVAASNLFISVDVNGVGKEPNAWGHDLFTFQVTDDGRLLPMGALGTRYTNMSLYCSPTSSDVQNGIACTEKALRDSKYFKNLPRGKKTID